MSVAWYIVLERNVPGFDHGIDGKVLGHASKALDAVAEEAGVPPLMEFFSASPEELAAFAEDQGIDSTDSELPAEAWFSAEDGLKTVRALLQAAEDGKLAGNIADELRAFKKVLEVARDNGVGWHLAVDF